MQDIAQAIGGSLARDGRGQMLAPLKMGANRIVGLADGVADTDAATVAQLSAAIAPPPPQRHDGIAVQGQTRIPATGDLIDNNGTPFADGLNFAVLIVNGVQLDASAFTYAGGDEPVLLTDPDGMDEGNVYTVIGSPQQGAGGFDGDFQYSKEQKPGFPAIGKSKSDKLSEHIALDDARTSWASDQDDIARATLIDDGYVNIRIRGGFGTDTQDASYRFSAEPFSGRAEGFKPGQPGYVENDPDATHYEESVGNLSKADGTPAHGITLYGDGPAVSKIKQVGNYAIFHNSRSEDPNDNLQGLTLRDLALIGPDLLDGDDDKPPQQNIHQLMLSGVNDLLCENVHFIGAQDDHVLFQPSPRPGLERHNERARFIGCLFDGLDGSTRNAISVEDLVGLWVYGCVFKRGVDLNGAIAVSYIDFEPRDQPWYRVRDALIQANTFEGMPDGQMARGACAMFLNNPGYYTLPTGSIHFWDNVVRGVKFGIEFEGLISSEMFGAGAIPHNCTVRRNLFENVERPIYLKGAHGFDYTDNRCYKTGSHVIGAPNYDKPNRNINIKRNWFEQVGSLDLLGSGVIFDYDARNVQVVDNDYVDVGRSDNLGGWGALIRAGDVELRLNENRVSNLLGRMKAFAQVGTNGSVRAGSQKVGNEVPLMTSPDNFDPPAPVSGVYSIYTFAGATIPANQTNPSFFDVPVSGATVGKGFEVVLNFSQQARGPNALLKIDAAVYATNTVRVVIQNSGSGALTIQSGDTMTVKERS